MRDSAACRRTCSFAPLELIRFAPSTHGLRGGFILAPLSRLASAGTGLKEIRKLCLVAISAGRTP